MKNKERTYLLTVTFTLFISDVKFSVKLLILKTYGSPDVRLSIVMTVVAFLPSITIVSPILLM